MPVPMIRDLRLAVSVDAAAKQRSFTSKTDAARVGLDTCSCFNGHQPDLRSQN